MNKLTLLALSLLLVGGGSLLAEIGASMDDTAQPGKTVKPGLQSSLLYVTNKGTKPVTLRAGYFPHQQKGIIPPMPGMPNPFIDKEVKSGQQETFAYDDNKLGTLKYVDYIDVTRPGSKPLDLITNVKTKTSYEITEKNGVWSVK